MGLINVSSDANRLSSATSYYCTSPPQPPSLAGLRLSTAPGTRHQIGVKIPRVSFAAVDGADNRDGLAGGELRHGGGFSIKTSAQCSSQQEAGRPAQSRQGQQSSIMGWVAYLSHCLHCWWGPLIGADGLGSQWVTQCQTPARKRRKKMATPSLCPCSTVSPSFSLPGIPSS